MVYITPRRGPPLRVNLQINYDEVLKDVPPRPNPTPEEIRKDKELRALIEERHPDQVIGFAKFVENHPQPQRYKLINLLSTSTCKGERSTTVLEFKDLQLTGRESHLITAIYHSPQNSDFRTSDVTTVEGINYMRRMSYLKRRAPCWNTFKLLHYLGP